MGDTREVAPSLAKPKGMARRTVEYVLEPVDEHGDIIDPTFYRTEKDALSWVAAEFERFPAAVEIHVARVTNYWDAPDQYAALEDREYDYLHKISRADGAL